jgi:hypothetical protein
VSIHHPFGSQVPARGRRCDDQRHDPPRVQRKKERDRADERAGRSRQPLSAVQDNYGAQGHERTDGDNEDEGWVQRDVGNGETRKGDKPDTR